VGGKKTDRSQSPILFPTLWFTGNKALSVLSSGSTYLCGKLSGKTIYLTTSMHFIPYSNDENVLMDIACTVCLYRAGMVKVGDRVLQINGCSMKDASQSDALTILRGASNSVTMEIEYEAELQGM